MGSVICPDQDMRPTSMSRGSGRNRGRQGETAARARGIALVVAAAGRPVGISFATVARIWRRWNIQPDRIETSKFSPPTPNRNPRSALLSGCIWPRRSRGRGLDRREEPDPGSGPHPARAAARPRLPAPPDPRLRPPRHHNTVRSPRGHDRQDQRRRVLPPRQTAASSS